MDYTADRDFKSFVNDGMCTDAVLRNFEVIGEAAKKIPVEVRNSHPDIPWERMIGLRNIVSHEYFGIDFSIIWHIIESNLSDLPSLISDMQKYIE
ncbi:MAG: DUF86 domain-containing protein [Actinobacteria bacterium]|nr:DUF86 domain-containing protein [Actinomycetota bacterium]